MSILVTILIYILVFCLLYWLIQILPIPAGPPGSPLPWIKTVLYIILVLAAIIVLLVFVGVHV
jgi:hypothetical protein